MDALTVHFTVSGTATVGVDYTALPASVVIPAGQSSVVLTVTPIDDAEIEGDESVSLMVQSGEGYAVGSPSMGLITIHDDDTPGCHPTLSAPRGAPSTQA